jgi:GNAT superfamily N-acetyltransferase
VSRYLIRPAGPRDAEPIARLHIASYRTAYRDVLPAGFLAGLTLADRERRWRASLRDPARSTFLTLMDNAAPRPVAFAETGVSRDGDATAARTAELIALHVAEDCWHQGVGRALHAHAIRALRDSGFADATLWVLTGNERARGFYAAMGWTPDGHARDLVVNGACIPEIRYRIGLAADARAAAVPPRG